MMARGGYQRENFSGLLPMESLHTQDSENIIGLGDRASVSKFATEKVANEDEKFEEIKQMQAGGRSTALEERKEILCSSEKPGFNTKSMRAFKVFHLINQSNIQLAFILLETSVDICLLLNLYPTCCHNKHQNNSVFYSSVYSSQKHLFWKFILCAVVFGRLSYILDALFRDTQLGHI